MLQVSCPTRWSLCCYWDFSDDHLSHRPDNSNVLVWCAPQPHGEIQGLMGVDYSKKFVATNVFIESKVGLFSSTFNSTASSDGIIEEGTFRTTLENARRLNQWWCREHWAVHHVGTPATKLSRIVAKICSIEFNLHPCITIHLGVSHSPITTEFIFVTSVKSSACVKLLSLG